MAKSPIRQRGCGVFWPKTCHALIVRVTGRQLCLQRWKHDISVEHDIEGASSTERRAWRVKVPSVERLASKRRASSVRTPTRRACSIDASTCRACSIEAASGERVALMHRASSVWRRSAERRACSVEALSTECRSAEHRASKHRASRCVRRASKHQAPSNDAPIVEHRVPSAEALTPRRASTKHRDARMRHLSVS
ncbi:UNVERIFIED_CONTAM: hypothetical protein FKN15_018542 [Acipenser sinensis]